MLNLNPGDVNELRRLLAAGAITEEQLSGMSIGGRFGGSPAPVGPSPQNELARILSPQEEFAQGGGEGDLPMGSMRNEETGRVTYFKPGGGGFSANPYPAAQAAPQRQPKIRLAGYGNGTLTDLGEEDGRALPVDYTRPAIDIPGLGKGRYTADGRYAVVSNPDGSQTKVVLGYDAAASDRGKMRDLKFRREELDNAMREEQLGAFRERRDQVAAGPAQTMTDANQAIPQAALEKIHGKPDKGYRWTQDGKLEPLPGGEVESKAQSGTAAMQTAIKNIDDLIGARDKEGNLTQGAKAHPGFETAVGVTGIEGAFGLAGLLPGTDTTNFKKRLEQLKGGAFLQAFEALKGGGQITQIEGEKATAAVTRMDTAQSEKEFITAAREFRDAVEGGMKKLAAKSGGVPAQRKLGQIYDTPKGQLRWMGNGWAKP